MNVTYKLFAGRGRRAFSALAFGALGLAGCVSRPDVVRVYDGRIAVERFVSDDAYATFLRGALAESSGDLRAALNEFERAAELDDDDPEILTRIGAIRCRLDPRDGAADRAFERAADIDPLYAGTLAARARCASSRGQAERAAVFAKAAAGADPANVSVAATLVGIEAHGRGDPASRARAIALTVAHGDNVAAWEALATWGRVRGDAQLFARGLVGLLRTAPTREREVERGAIELLGTGRLGLARFVSAALADEPVRFGLRGPHDSTVARLAVDAALIAGDDARALARASRGHVPRVEVVVRAELFGRWVFAETIARELEEAAFDVSTGRLLLSSTRASTSLESREPRESREAALSSPTIELPFACAVVLARHLAETVGPVAAREWFGRTRRAPMPAHDPLVGPVAVELAAREILPEAILSLELQIELAARRRQPPPPAPQSGAPSGQGERNLGGQQLAASLDPKHWLLLFALREPHSEQARGLASALTSAGRDPVVSVARSMIVTRATEAQAIVNAALESSPTDPLLLARAVELAGRPGAGTNDAATTMRARLMAVATTEAERSLARDGS